MSYTFDNLQCNNFDVTTQLDMCGFKITNVAVPILGSSDAARVQEITSRKGNLSTKLSCQYATVSNIADFTTKAIVEAALDTVGAVAPTLINGDRVLVKDQGTTTENGIYQWDNGIVQLIRASDHDGTAGNEIKGGDYTFVVEGDVLGNSGYIIVGSGIRTIGVDAVLWTSFTGNTTSHTTLSNIGVDTHAQIDAHIADTTIHFTEASIDHTAILNIGTNTHAQIDTHIASTTNPHSVTFDQVTPTTTKGDIIARNSTVTTRLGIGANDQILIANSSQPTGVQWVDPGITKLDGYDKYYSTLMQAPVPRFELHVTGTTSDSTDNYGGSCAVGGKVVVGAPLDDVAASNAGAVFVYNPSLVQETKLFASDAQASDFYGTSVSIAVPNFGFFNSYFIIVGAPGEDTGGSAEGAVYFVHYDGSIYTEFQKIQASDPTGGSNFGQSVDIDASGRFAIIGAPNKNDGGTSRGVVYGFQNFSGISGTWTQSFRISDPSPLVNGHFGQSVSYGDNIAVGRPGTGLGQGIVYILDTVSGAIVQTITPSDSASVSLFGQTVCCKSNTLVVGCATTFNQIYIFKKISFTAEFVETQIIIPSILLDNYYFDIYRGNQNDIAGNYITIGGKTTGVNTATILNYSNYDGDNEIQNEYIYYIYNTYTSGGAGPSVQSVGNGGLSAYINDNGVGALGDLGTYYYAGWFFNGSNSSIAVSKDGRWFVFIATRLSNNEVFYYLKDGDRWIFKFYSVVPGAFISSNNLPVIAISDVNSSNGQYVVAYYQQGYGTDQTIYRRIIIDDDTLGAETTINITTKHASEVTFTPTASSTVSSLDVCWLAGNPYYAFTILDAPDAYIRHRKETISVASDAVFLKDVSTYVSAPVEINKESSGIPYISAGLGNWYIWRLTTGPQTIASGASYDYNTPIPGVKSTSEKTSSITSDGKYLLMNPYYPLSNVPGTGFSGRLNGYPGARVDLWTDNGTTFDFKYAIMQMISDGTAGQFNGNNGIVEVIKVATDAKRFIGQLEFTVNGSSVNRHPVVCELDSICNEWMIKYNYYVPKYAVNQIPYISITEFNNINGQKRYTQATDDNITNIVGISDNTNIFNINMNRENIQIDKRYDLLSTYGFSTYASYHFVDRHNQLRKPLSLITRALDAEWQPTLTVQNNPVSYFSENTTPASTTLVAFLSFLSFTQSVDSGTYLLELSATYGVSNTTSLISIRTQQNGTNIFNAAQDVVEQMYNTSERSVVSPSTIVNLSGGSYTWDISFNNSAGATSTVYYASIRVTKVA